MDGDLFSDLVGGGKPKESSSNVKSVDIPREFAGETVSLDKEELKQLVTSSINAALETTLGNFVKSIRTVLEDMGRKIEGNTAAVTEIREYLDLLKDVVDAQSENFHSRFTSVDMAVREVDRGVQAIRDKAELQEAQAQLAKMAGVKDKKETEERTASAADAVAPAASPAPAATPAPAPAAAPAAAVAPAVASASVIPTSVPGPAASPVPQVPPQQLFAAAMPTQAPQPGMPALQQMPVPMPLPQQAPQYSAPLMSQYSPQPGPGGIPAQMQMHPGSMVSPQMGMPAPMPGPPGGIQQPGGPPFMPPQGPGPQQGGPGGPGGPAPFQYPQRGPSHSQYQQPVQHPMYSNGPGGPAIGGGGGGPYRQNSASSAASPRSQAGPPSEVRPTSRSVPLEQVITDISNMGFDRGQIMAVINSLQKSGQSVDLNVILDRLTRGDYS